jgi:hypothetical protein
MGVGTVIMKPFGGGAFFNANTALKFVLSRENFDVVIPRMMNVAEVEENVAVASEPHSLTPGELELIERDRGTREPVLQGVQLLPAVPPGDPDYHHPESQEPDAQAHGMEAQVRGAPLRFR